MCYSGRLGSLFTQKLCKAKGIVPFSCHVTCETLYILLACVLFPALRATSSVQYSKLQMAKTVVKYLLFECTILILPLKASYAWENIKHNMHSCSIYIHTYIYLSYV